MTDEESNFSTEPESTLGSPSSEDETITSIVLAIGVAGKLPTIEEFAALMCDRVSQLAHELNHEHFDGELMLLPAVEPVDDTEVKDRDDV